jgi:anti-sigma factor RsiW
MNCPQVSNQREIVLDYCAGALDRDRATEFEQHIEHCGDCREAVSEQRRVWETLDHWTAPAVSGNFDARLYARIANEEAAPAWRRWLRGIIPPVAPFAFWKPAVSLAAACAVLTVGLMVHAPFVHAPKPAQPAAQAGPAPAAQVDIEQVANALDELDLLAPAKI